MPRDQGHGRNGRFVLRANAHDCSLAHDLRRIRCCLEHPKFEFDCEMVRFDVSIRVAHRRIERTFCQIPRAVERH